MRKSLISLAAASMLLAGAGIACAQSEAPSAPTWQTNQGQIMEQYSTTMHYDSYMDSNLNPQVGIVLPDNVTVYPLPGTLNVPSSTEYRYSIINNHPVVIETTTRRVVHTWD